MVRSSLARPRLLMHLSLLLQKKIPAMRTGFEGKKNPEPEAAELCDKLKLHISERETAKGGSWYGPATRTVLAKAAPIEGGTAHMDNPAKKAQADQTTKACSRYSARSRDTVIQSTSALSILHCTVYSAYFNLALLVLTHTLLDIYMSFQALQTRCLTYTGSLCLNM